jgi:hypothetical protein
MLAICRIECISVRTLSYVTIVDTVVECGCVVKKKKTKNEYGVKVHDWILNVYNKQESQIILPTPSYDIGFSSTLYVTLIFFPIICSPATLLAAVITLKKGFYIQAYECFQTK